jgi:hypothetical protein
MRETDELFAALAKSAFRRKFKLQGKDLQYLHSKGLPVIREHARDFINQRLAPALIANDGKQTPYRGHPVFVAQHATACCCRGCLQKWHNIEPGRALDADELDYVVNVIAHWLEKEMRRSQAAPTFVQYDLFKESLDTQKSPSPFGERRKS